MSEELSRAAFEGDVERLGRLLDEGTNIDGQGRIWNALHAAIENDRIDCARLLIQRGADVECRAAGDLSPLAHAVDVAIDGIRQQGGSPGEEPTDMINLLLEAGADPASGLDVARGYESPNIIELLTTSMQRRLTRR